MSHTLIIDPDGAVRFIYDDELADLLGQGRSVTQRASHVGPVGTQWWVDLGPVRGPMLGPFKLRKQALIAEHDWLIKSDIPIPK